jgi:nitric oxide reductase large subunit
MQTLRWMRVPGDTIFAIGAIVLVAFVFLGRVQETEHAPADVVMNPAGD